MAVVQQKDHHSLKRHVSVASENQRWLAYAAGAIFLPKTLLPGSLESPKNSWCGYPQFSVDLKNFSNFFCSQESVGPTLW